MRWRRDLCQGVVTQRPGPQYCDMLNTYSDGDSGSFHTEIPRVLDLLCTGKDPNKDTAAEAVVAGADGTSNAEHSTGLLGH